jgi:uncharacterized protein
MPEYLSPAVYVEELSSGVKPIEGVGTSTAGFVGIAVKGPIGVATPINNFGEFVRRFGAFHSNGLLPFGVKAFFDEGGRTCYVVRTCHFTAGSPDAVAALRTYTTTSDNLINALRVSASSRGAWGNALSVRVTHGGPGQFRLEVFEDGVAVENYDALTMNPADQSPEPDQKAYVEARINSVSERIRVTDLAIGTAAVDPRPIPTNPVGALDPLLSGADGLASLGVNDFVGTSADGIGLNAFNKIEEINIVAVPEKVDRKVHVAGVAYCEHRQDCVYIADSQSSVGVSADEVLEFKNGEGVFAGNAITSKYGALYAPWIEVLDPRSGAKIAIPPSAAVAGRYAATDAARGVHKAPAGIVDGKLSTVLGLQFSFVNADQEKLNPKGINLIRSFPGTGPVIWGARTVSSDPEWRYLNVRRLFIFLRQSILLATTWVVFEPNDPTLWKSIERNVSAFLFLQWLAGALVGETPGQAFYVKCDAETNPIESIKLGRVITEIGVAPSKPAEFVIFRISQFDGGASSTA